MKSETPLSARAAVRALTASKIRELYNEGVGNPAVRYPRGAPPHAFHDRTA